MIENGSVGEDTEFRSISTTSEHYAQLRQHSGYKQRNKVTLIICLLKIIDRKQNNLTAITEFGVAVTTSNFPNEFSNIAGVFNIGSRRLLIRFNSQYPKTTLKHCQKNEKLLAYPRELYLWTEQFQCQYRFRTFQIRNEILQFSRKNPAKFHRTIKKLTLGAWHSLKKVSPEFGSCPVFYEIVINQSDRPESKKSYIR